MMPPGKIHDLQFRGIRAITRPGPPNAHPDGDSTMFFQGHPLSSIENILLQDINITFSGGGTLEQANRRDIVDMDKIDYRKDGYWTDHKTTWGIPPAYGLYARHLKGLTLENVTFQLAGSDQRSAIFVSDSEEIQVSGFKAACDPPEVAVVTAVNCSGMRLSGMDASPKAAALLRLEGAASNGIVIGANRPGKFAKDVEYANGATEKAVLRQNG